MDQNTIDDLAFQVRHRLIDYLKAAKLHLDMSDPLDIRTICPYCGRMAFAQETFLGSPLPTWECGFCGEKGNTIDYARIYFGLTERKAIIDVCRRLGIRITHLETITAASLMDKQFDPQYELIEGMLAPGLYILAGASKIGKSWLVLQIAHCVSMGAIPMGAKGSKERGPVSRSGGYGAKTPKPADTDLWRRNRRYQLRD